MEIMQPLTSEHLPKENGWVYEIKYDGFRCVLHWELDGVTLISRNNKDLTCHFPEVTAFCRQLQAEAKPFLPLRLDGELVILNNKYQANFTWIQKRGRLKSASAIKKAADMRPASFLAFDLLQMNGKMLHTTPYSVRKSKLKAFIEKLSLTEKYSLPLAYVKTYENAHELQDIVFRFKAEGIIAKRKSANYLPGKNHRDWFKIKNWRTIYGLLTSFNLSNGYYSVQVSDGDEFLSIGKCKHGLDQEQASALKQLFLTKGKKQGNTYTLPPAICARIHTLDLHKAELREPQFAGLIPGAAVENYTASRLKLDMAMLPEQIALTNTEKVFWPDSGMKKGDLLVYLREISPYMLPFLKERALTIIRSPDGVTGSHFFQKHLPDYAPDFIESREIKGEHKLLCNTLAGLLWFANHGAIEYHVPFQHIGKKEPAEIVFDLDPPGREKFHAAIQAALLIKQLLDDLSLQAFVKTSGNKGLQIHIPIREGSLSYTETAVFTQAVATTLETAYPSLFTTERLKNKRHGRLYIDYVQHAQDKTIIAPYSPRKTMDATIATPLFWEEVKAGLTPAQFTISNVLERVQTRGCPFAGYFEAGKKQKLDKLLKLVNG